MFNKIKKITFRIITKIPRTYYSLLKLRPDSYPYITGDGFRKMTDHIYDETGKCQAHDIKDKQIVFLKTDLIDEWFADVHPKITAKYKLITHNSDRSIGEKEASYIDDKIIHWFAQNAIVSDPKITPIPIGLENKRYFYNGIPYLFNKIRKNRINKKNRILFGFSIKTNSTERKPTFEALTRCEIADKIEGFPTPNSYLKILKQYKFVASPPGNGIDCHRTWEAIYLGVIPIVKESICMNYFSALGLPILVVKNYDNISISDYKAINTDILPLYIDYWINKIKKYDYK
jgi:hypothetical protein